MDKDAITLLGHEHRLPCLVADVPNAVYQELRDNEGNRVVGSSGIRQLMQSPGLYYSGGKSFDAVAAGKGTALHAAVAEPKEFEELVTKDPWVPVLDSKKNLTGEMKEASRNSDAYKDARDAWLNHTAGAGVMLKEKDYNAVLAMRDEILAYDEFPGLWERPWLAERTIVWRDADTGIVCRCRPDLLRLRNETEAALCLDLKTNHSGDPNQFDRAAFEHGYHVQEAWYTEGLRAADIDVGVDGFRFLVVGKSPPYAVSLRRFDAFQVNEARDECLEALLLLVWCRRNGKWPKNHRPSDIEQPFRDAGKHDGKMRTMRGYAKAVRDTEPTENQLEEEHVNV